MKLHYYSETDSFYVNFYQKSSAESIEKKVDSRPEKISFLLNYTSGANGEGKW